MATGEIPALEESTLELVAHNIKVLGHMWTFRRWFLRRYYTVEEYIAIQTSLLCGELFGFGQVRRTP